MLNAVIFGLGGFGAFLILLAILFIIKNAAAKKSETGRGRVHPAIIVLLIIFGLGFASTAFFMYCAKDFLSEVTGSFKEELAHTKVDTGSFSTYMKENYGCEVYSDEEIAKNTGAEKVLFAVHPEDLFTIELYAFSDGEKAEADYESEKALLEGMNNKASFNMMGINMVAAQDDEGSIIVYNIFNTVMVGSSSKLDVSRLGDLIKEVNDSLKFDTVSGNDADKAPDT